MQSGFPSFPTANPKASPCALVLHMSKIPEMVCSVWTVVSSLWTVVCGLWAVVCGLWSVTCGG